MHSKKKLRGPKGIPLRTYPVSAVQECGCRVPVVSALPASEDAFAVGVAVTCKVHWGRV